MCTRKGALKNIHAVRNSQLYLLQVKKSHLLTKQETITRKLYHTQTLATKGDVTQDDSQRRFFNATQRCNVGTML